jgi:F420-non-reducing hydrogenase small subunit
VAEKLQIAKYWGAACGGCDVSLLDTNEFILDIAAAADIRFWPIAVDGKYSDLEAMDDGELDVSFFNGAVRNSENEHVAKLMRQKSKLMVAYGSCAHMGGIPGLANLTSKDEIFDRAYLHNPSIQQDNTTLPLPESTDDGYELEIPVFYERVYKLDDVIDVDYYLPGCPPAPAQVKAAVLALVGALTGQSPAPPKGAVVGASEVAVCEDCPRTREEKKISKFYRPWQIIQDPERCLLEQGIPCAGIVTRSGCGVRCPNTNMPCRGCYGPLPNVTDQGAKFVSALGSIIDSKDPEEIDQIIADIPDIAGLSYRFGLPASLLQRKVTP